MSQLQKLRKKYAYPSANRLYDLLKPGGIHSIAPKTLEKLGYIMSTCEPRQKASTAPRSYRVAMGAEKIQLYTKVHII